MSLLLNNFIDIFIKIIVIYTKKYTFLKLKYYICFYKKTSLHLNLNFRYMESIH